MNQFPDPIQLLRKETYFDEDWFEREKQELFSESWVFACTEETVAAAGDFFTLQFFEHPLMVLRDDAGELRAFHNVCRHRGCEVLEESGNTGKVIVCPYHRWTYELDGSLRGIPNETECFGDVNRESLGLLPASVGTYRGMVFVNPSPTPTDDFEAWIANMDDESWPHSFTDGSMKYAGSMTYEMQCNWKVFYENAIDGYHLGYLHDQTLGKLYPQKNIWRQVGRNVVWYSTEREGAPQSNSILSEELADKYWTPRIDGHDTAPYPGVVMMFPLTILSPSPWGFYISVLEPISAEVTLMHTHSWDPNGKGGRLLRAGEIVRLADMDKHPTESGNFQIEDMWIVEKIQRTLHSPHYQVGPLAKGDGAEAPLMHFQQQVLEFVKGN